VTAPDVVIVGGGPAGASTASLLAGAGVRVSVLERARFPRRKPCAEFLSPACGRLLSELGVLEQCTALPHATLSGMHVRAPGGVLIDGSYPSDGGVPNRALSIQRELLDTVLLERARELGADVQAETRVSDLLRDGNGRVAGVIACDRSGRTRELRAPLVVGADGLRSVVAARLALRTRWRWPRRIGLVSYWEDVNLPDGHGEMHVERDGFVGLAPVGGGLVNMSLVIPADRGREVAGRAADFYEHWLRTRPQLDGHLRSARRTGALLVTGPFATRARRGWAPGAVLAGDAAGYFDPFTGEGIFTALRAGEQLAPRVLRGLAGGAGAALDSQLRGYDRDRRSEQRPRLMVEAAIAMFVGHPTLMDHAARSLARRPDMAALLASVCGDLLPPRRVLNAGYILRLLALPFFPATWARAVGSATP
jgi:menaquinone-9 beta-reductase